MKKRLYPIEIECDAPPYPVVQASRQAGIRSPEDVRWIRLSHDDPGRPAAPESAAAFWAAPGRSVRTSCRCGEVLPKFLRVIFSFASGATLSLVLVQCPRCRTVYWDEA